MSQEVDLLRPPKEVIDMPMAESFSGTKLIRKFKLKANFESFRDEIDSLFPLKDYKWHDEFPSPNGTWFYNVNEGDMPQHLENIINESIGVKIKPFSFLWNWDCKTIDLLAHRDDYHAATKADHPISDFDRVVFLEDARQNKRKLRTAPLNVVVALENFTKTDIFNERTNQWETSSYGPGEIIFFDNENFWHRATVIGNDRNISPKRSLNCYVDPTELDAHPDFFDNLDENDMKIA